MLVVSVAIGVVVGLVGLVRARYDRPRAVVVVFAAAVTQLVSASVTGTMHVVLLVASVLLGLLWLGFQRHHLASGLLRVGACLNVAVVAVNGGMPVDAGALEAVGRGGVDVSQGYLYKHIAMTGDTRLAWLGDLIPVPFQRNVVSVGDVFMAAAICLWVAGEAACWRQARGSASAVHGEHGCGPGGEVAGSGSGPDLSEDRVGRFIAREPAVHL